MGSSKKQTIGYKYYLGMHMALCHGPIDAVFRIFVDDRLAWTGNSTGGTINISASELFGGEKKEGGISGAVDLEFGESTQGVNSYLLGQLGSDTPAFRGVMCAVLNQCYMGNNPYLKPWSFELSRIHVLEDGSTQWYDAKASIPNILPWELPLSSGGWEWQKLPYHADPGNTNLEVPTTGWETSPLATLPVGAPTSLTPANLWDRTPELSVFWIRQTITTPGGPMMGTVYAENGAVMFVNGAEVGSSNRNNLNIFSNQNNPVSFSFNAAGTFVLAVKAFTEPFDTPDWQNGNYLDFSFVNTATADMNPAHIIRETLTESWGLGYSSSDIDDTSFTAAADTLFDERMGISILWDKEIPLEDFISIIKQHINAELYVSRSTGKFVLKLIRDDYTVGSLLVLDETNSQMAEKASRPSIGELVTSVTVQFTDTISADEQGSVTVHNEALIQMQGIDRGATAQYPGFSNRSIATRVALRDLQSLSTPLLSAEVTANREAADLNVGDVFVLNFPEQGITSLVMRVQSIAVGDGLDNSINIRCIEDAFSAPPVSVVVDDTIRWTDPVTVPAEVASPRVVMEAPYYELVQDQGQITVDTALTSDPDLGYMAATAGRQGNELNANLLVDSGAGYVDSAVLDFAAYATLATDAWYSDANLYYSGGKDLDIPVAGDLAQIGDEIVRFDALGTDSNGTFMTVGRGVLDTVPAEHTAGASIVFFDLASDEVQYTASDSVDVKIQTTLGSSTSAGEPVDNVVMGSRAIRPYPPGDLQVDGFSYDPNIVYQEGMTITWKHRDRLQQTSGTVFDYTDASIGPEAGTTYIVRADTLTNGTPGIDFIDETVGNVLTYTHAGSDGAPVPGVDFVRWKVYALRGGYESWQPAAVKVIAEVDSNLMLWTPSLITTELWLDASESSSVVHIADSVSAWNDLSGNAYHVGQTTEANKPTRVAADQNGLDVISFDGTNDNLRTVASPTNLFRNIEKAMYFSVQKWATTPASSKVIFRVSTNVSTTSRVQIGSHASLETWREVGRRLDGDAAQDGGPAGTLDTSWDLCSGVFDYSTTYQAMYQNGTIGTPNTSYHTAGSTSDTASVLLTIGNALSSFHANAKIGEVIVVHDTVDTSTRHQIEGYLAWKWGIASELPVSHPFKSAPPYTL